MIRMLLLCALAAGAQDLLHQGAQAIRDGRFADAEHIYRQLLKSAPEDARLHMNLGLALHSAANYREALVEFDRYLKANPQPGPVHLLAGVDRLKLGRHCDAIAPLETAR